jgi:hypothetical protein
MVVQHHGKLGAYELLRRITVLVGLVPAQKGEDLVKGGIVCGRVVVQVDCFLGRAYQPAAVLVDKRPNLLKTRVLGMAGKADEK